MRQIITAFVLFFLLCVTTVSAQTGEARDSDQERSADQVEKPVPDQPQERDWHGELGTFRIGIVTDSNARQAVALAEPFRLAIEEVLDLPVDIIPVPDFTALVSALTTSRVEYAVLSAFAYASAWNLCECVEPLVIAQTAQGAYRFRQVIIARTDGASELNEMRGRTLAVVGMGTAGGPMLAQYEIEKEGMNFGTGGIEFKNFPDSAQAIGAFANGEVDALLGWQVVTGAGDENSTQGTLELIATQVPGDLRYRTIWESSPIPYRVHAIRRNLPGEAKTLLRGLLTNMFSSDPVAYDAIEPFHGGGFVAARQGLFEKLSQMLAEKGIGGEETGSQPKTPAAQQNAQ